MSIYDIPSNIVYEVLFGDLNKSEEYFFRIIDPNKSEEYTVHGNPFEVVSAICLRDAPSITLAKGQSFNLHLPKRSFMNAFISIIQYYKLPDSFVKGLSRMPGLDVMDVSFVANGKRIKFTSLALVKVLGANKEETLFAFKDGKCLKHPLIKMPEISDFDDKEYENSL